MTYYCQMLFPRQDLSLPWLYSGYSEDAIGFRELWWGMGWINVKSSGWQLNYQSCVFFDLEP